jgi:hypothetical protein
VWRETTAPLWQNHKDVGNVTRFTLPVSKDNVAFGVQAIDKDGNVSVASFPRPFQPQAQTPGAPGATAPTTPAPAAGQAPAATPPAPKAAAPATPPSAPKAPAPAAAPPPTPKKP